MKEFKYLRVVGSSNRKFKHHDEYFRGVKLVSRSRLYTGNLIRGINAWTVSVVSYN